MKLKITYDKAKDKFYFDYDDGTLETFYGLYAANENLNIIQRHLSYATCEKLLIQLSCNVIPLLEIEV